MLSDNKRETRCHAKLECICFKLLSFPLIDVKWLDVNLINLSMYLNN